MRGRSCGAAARARAGGDGAGGRPERVESSIISTVDSRRRGAQPLVTPPILRLAAAAGVALALACTPLRAAAPAPEALTPATFEKLSGIHFGYRPGDVPESELAALPQSFPDGKPGDMTMSERDGGYRDEIGLVTKSAARWAITFDKRAEANMIANAKSSRWFPIHLQDPVHGGPVRFDLNPYKSLTASTKGDDQVKPDPVGNPAIIVDTAHEPHFLYFYALLMRARGNDAEFRWALEEMKYWCAWNYLQMTDHGRGFAKGIFNPIATQPRAAAWSFAALLQLYRVLPKDDPWYPSVKYSVEQNILFLDGNFRRGDYDNGPFKPYYDWPSKVFRNTLGLLQGRDPGYGNGVDGKRQMIGAFQMAFQAQVVLFGYGLGLDLGEPAKSAYRDLALFVARWPVTLFGPAHTPGAYDWRRAGEYSMAVGTLRPDGFWDYFDNGGAMLDANYARLPPLPDDRSFRQHDENTPLDSIATGFVDDIVPALSLALDVGAPGAADAYARAESAVQWPRGGAYQFAILPKGKYFRPAPAGGRH